MLVRFDHMIIENQTYHISIVRADRVKIGWLKLDCIIQRIPS